MMFFFFLKFLLRIFLGRVAVTRLKEEKVRFGEVLDRLEIEESITLKSNSGENQQLTTEKDSCGKKNWMNPAQLWRAETKLVILTDVIGFKRHLCKLPVFKTLFAFKVQHKVYCVVCTWPYSSLAKMVLNPL